jgi:hypothetical protein
MHVQPLGLVGGGTLSGRVGLSWLLEQPLQPFLPARSS